MIKVNDIVRFKTDSGKYRVWQVVGVFLGAENQEGLIELVPLDQPQNKEGRILVPEEILNRLFIIPDTGCSWIQLSQ